MTEQEVARVKIETPSTSSLEERKGGILAEDVEDDTAYVVEKR
jgi:hypothetical protein